MQQRKPDKALTAIIIAGVVVWAAVWLTIIYVAYHFISKHW